MIVFAGDQDEGPQSKPGIVVIELLSHLQFFRGDFGPRYYNRASFLRATFAFFNEIIFSASASPLLTFFHYTVVYGMVCFVCMFVCYRYRGRFNKIPSS